MSGSEWPPPDAIAITLRIRDDAGTSYITPSSTRELIGRLRALQTAMGSAQLVARQLEQQLATPPAERPTLALFGEQAATIVAAIEAWLGTPIPDDVEKLRTALESEQQPDQT
jgi:hypothetical protein